jgi:hypothetical protein
VKILFVMASPEYLRFYDSTIDELASRGHHVVLAVNNQREKKPVGLEGLRTYAGRTTILGVVPQHDGVWGDLACGLRGTMDFVRYLHPRFAAAPVLRARIKRKALPVALRWLDAIPSAPPAVVRGLVRVLAGCERAIPLSEEILGVLREQAPDVLLVSPLVDAASDQVDWIKAARRLRIRTAACIASWDNLTNKGLLRVEPDVVMVWNDAQKQEAHEYHYIAAENIVTTGAQLFDRWFTRRATRDREAFCARVGLPDTAPFVLFTGSSSFISESTAEVAFVRRWIETLRSSAVPSVRDLHVLVRPHPYNCSAWERTDPARLPGTAIWPRRTYNAVDEDNRADFFDSLYHAEAIVGINTSAMIEAAIVGRPVFSIVSEDFAGTQEGTIHFHHLQPENGGCVRIAASLEEHVRQLAERLKDPEAARAETQRFVASFVRPHGMDRPATPIVADAIERLGQRGPTSAVTVPVWAYAIRPVLLASGALSAAVTQLSRPDPLGPLMKRLRHRVHRGSKASRRLYGITADRVRRSGRRLAKGMRRTAATGESLQRAAGHGWRRMARGLRHARYAAAVFVRDVAGAAPRRDE